MNISMKCLFGFILQGLLFFSLLTSTFAAGEKSMGGASLAHDESGICSPGSRPNYDESGRTIMHKHAFQDKQKRWVTYPHNHGCVLSQVYQDASTCNEGGEDIHCVKIADNVFYRVEKNELGLHYQSYTNKVFHNRMQTSPNERSSFIQSTVVHNTEVPSVFGDQSYEQFIEGINHGTEEYTKVTDVSFETFSGNSTLPDSWTVKTSQDGEVHIEWGVDLPKNNNLSKKDHLLLAFHYHWPSADNETRVVTVSYDKESHIQHEVLRLSPGDRFNKGSGQMGVKLPIPPEGATKAKISFDLLSTAENGYWLAIDNVYLLQPK